MFDFFKKREKYNLGYFCTALVWHCNLNCRYCDHFSPVAKEKFFDVKKIEKDFRRIAKFFNVQSIGLMGGEPLLHTKLSYIFDIARKIFPDTYLITFTNGILLDKMEEDFWKSAGRNRIVIRITKYKININVSSIIQKARKHNVRIEWEGVKNGKFKTMHKICLDLEGKQNPEDMYKECWHRKICCYFEEGKFFLCPVAGNIRHFNEYFNKNLELSKGDYLDIYKVKNISEIEQYFTHPMEFCKYCNVRAQKDNLPFEISKREITDWC